MAKAIYVLCAATSCLAAWLLLRTFLVRRTRLLLWSSVAFVGLAVNNILVFVDLALFTSIDLALVRSLAGMAAMLALLYGLIWEERA